MSTPTPSTPGAAPRILYASGVRHLIDPSATTQDLIDEAMDLLEQGRGLIASCFEHKHRESHLAAAYRLLTMADNLFQAAFEVKP